jgi:hypothetical protein
VELPIKKLFFNSLCIIFLFGQELVGETCNGYRSNISLQVQKEIDRQLDADKLNHEKKKPLRKKISSCVHTELNKQIFTKLRNHAEKNVYKKKNDYGLIKDQVLFIYKVPEWPRQSQVFLKKDLLGFNGRLQFATQAYGSSGGTKDISHKIFQEGAIYLKDIVLASKLIDLGAAAVAADKYNFLEILKDQLFKFDASIDEQSFAFSYIRHFLEGDISLGLQLPIVRRAHKIKLTSSLTAQLRDQLESESTDFFTTYPNGLIDLLKDILSKKNINFNESDSEGGLGDLSLFANYEVPTRHCERCFVGVRALLPTSRSRDVYKLWDPELGNGGFTELSLFGSLLFNQSRWFNPHCFLQATYVVPATVFRRVPKTVSNTDIESVSNAKKKFGDDFMIYGNGVKYLSTEPEFSQLDTTVRRFSDETRKTKVHPGGNLFLRVGNMIEEAFSERLFFDTFYELFAKWRDYIGFRRDDDVYEPSLLVNNTYEVAHRVGANLSWQADDSWRMHLGGMYTFAGRNTFRLFEINGAISLEF